VNEIYHAINLRECVHMLATLDHAFFGDKLQPKTGIMIDVA
jgi:hypothetical protein